jgi:hypothetical protein
MVAEFHLDDDDEQGGDVLWRVGLAPLPEGRWHELAAAHAVKGDAPRDVQDTAQEAFATDLTANTCVWEEYDDGPRTDLTAGDVAAWPDRLNPDVWLALVEFSFRVSGPTGFEWATERIRRSPLLALEMAVAREYRIPYSQLMGWTGDDRALAVADLVEQRSTCSGCGVPRRAMRDYDAAIVDVDVCVWCAMLAQSQREASDGEHPRVALKAGY